MQIQSTVRRRARQNGNSLKRAANADIERLEALVQDMRGGKMSVERFDCEFGRIRDRAKRRIDRMQYWFAVSNGEAVAG